MSDIVAAREALREARALIPAHRQHVLIALDDLLDDAEHDPAEARAHLERMGPVFAKAGPVAVVLVVLADELKGAALDAADHEVLRLMQPKRRRRAA